MRSLLMIAFHYPPIRGGSGVHRTLSFSRHLLEFGWKPIVLTVHPRAHQFTDPAQLERIPEEVEVARAFALDTRRHLSIRGSYPILFAVPDSWSSWYLGGVPTGLNLIRKHRPAAIWSTYPIATAHWIASTLNRRTRLPWVADIRDPMWEECHPPDPWQHRAYRGIESRVVRQAARMTLTSPGTKQLYLERYPDIEESRWTVIDNGYEEEAFTSLEPLPERSSRKEGPITLLHSGALYPDSRDPRALFDALARLRDEKRISPADLRIVLRATGHDGFVKGELAKRSLEEYFEIAPTVPYADALREMIDSDGLLVLQASSCNIQIPAKLYEYMRARRPILALTDPVGDTASVVRDAGIETLYPLDCADSIATGLMDFLQRIRDGRPSLATPEAVAGHARQRKCERLAELLDEVAG